MLGKWQLELFQGLDEDETAPNELSVQEMSNCVSKYLFLCYNKKSRVQACVHIKLSRLNNSNKTPKEQLGTTYSPT